VVADNIRCASACALIWMGGTERYMGLRARLGFHSTRMTWNRNDARYNEVHEYGNSLVTRYLRQLGVVELESIRLISAPPNSMTWVTPDSLASYGISASYFCPSDEKWSWMLVTWPIPRTRQRIDPTTSTEKLFGDWIAKGKT
jgi:hypothetical protein